MSRGLVVILVLAGVCTSAGAVDAQPSTRLTLSAPQTVALGDEIELEARLLSGAGRPVPGAVLELRQVGAVGERVIAQETTDAQGTAFFVHREYTVPLLTLRVAFRGGAGQAAAYADAVVPVSGIELRPSVVMAHSPSPAIKGVLFLLLGSVWLTYIYAASRVARVALEDRKPTQGGRTR